MTETGKFLQRAALAGAVAIPIAASSSVITRGDGDAWIPERCAGCGAVFRASELTRGEADTRWCAECIADTSPPAPESLPFDCVAEDDGEP